MRGAQILSLALFVLCGQSLAVPLEKTELERPDKSVAVRGDNDQLGDKWKRDEDEPGLAWKRDEDEPGCAWKRNDDEPGDKWKRSTIEVRDCASDVY